MSPPCGNVTTTTIAETACCKKELNFNHESNNNNTRRLHQRSKSEPTQPTYRPDQGHKTTSRRKAPIKMSFTQILLILLSMYQILAIVCRKEEGHSGWTTITTQPESYNDTTLAFDRILSSSKYSAKPNAVVFNEDESVYPITLQLQKHSALNQATSHIISTVDRDSDSWDSSDDDDHNTDCVPMHDWQSQFYPTCNSMHELSFFSGLFATDNARLVDGGQYRDVWDIRVGHNGTAQERWALKTLQMGRFLPFAMEGQMTDAIISERLTFSKYVASIYGFCGGSALYEFASEGTLRHHYAYLNKHERLKAAYEISRGLADVHTFGSRNGYSAIAHLDLVERQYIKMHGRYVLNDMNCAELLEWNTRENRTCKVEKKQHIDRNRAPEEMKDDWNLKDEKADVYSLGNIFYELLQNHRRFAFLDNEIAGKLIVAGHLPKLPDFLEHSTDRVVVALKRAMKMCLVRVPEERASAKQVADYLEGQLKAHEEEMQNKKKAATT